MSKQDRAYITRMVEGVTEKRMRLDYIVNQFSKTKINKCKPLIRCVLRMGTYEIFYMDSVQDHTACNLCVKLAADHGFGSLRGFVNGVLRNIARNKDSIVFPDQEKDKRAYYSVMYSVPEELLEILERDYDYETIDRILASGDSDRPTAISGYDYIRKVPGFFDGEFVVQDQSSCLAVKAAGINEGDLVVDVCAAPGGKTMYAAMLTGSEGHVISRDLIDKKTELIEENIERLGLSNVTVQVHDAREFDEELTGKADVVIADLPCSGLGIMGRKNDIKYHVSMESVKELAQLQREILDTVCRYVKPGGTLVYSTCTIDSIENDENAVWFADTHDFSLCGIDDVVPEHGGERGFVTLHQGIDECDGFFISKFRADSNNQIGQE